jgi:hypothetical protein
MEVMERGDPLAMVRLLLVLSFASLFSQASSLAQQPGYYQLLPDSVQAVVWIRDTTDLGNRWNSTLLRELAHDDKVRDFFKEQHDSIQQKLMDAGWRLGVRPESLSEFIKGQVAVAWLEKAEPRKPFALAFIADVEQDADANARMLSQIDTDISRNKVSKKQSSHLDQQITQYVMPKRPGQLLDENSYLAVVKDKLLVTDDQQLIHELIAKVLGQNVATKPLAGDPEFIKSREQLKVSDSAHIEYFVRPLGIAKVIRDIGGKKSRSGADLLAVLKNQGFSAVKCVCGEVWIGEGDSDMSHRGFVLADFPLPKAAAVLDFPNQALIEIPRFVSPDACSYLASKWNSQEAFWKVETLVDELAGTPGTFKEVISGLKKDINGPQVDIRTEVLPLLTNDVVAITDNQPGEIQLNSRRNLIGIRVNDGPKAVKIVDRIMKGEAQGELTDYDGISIWVTNNEPIDGSEEFSDFPGATDDDNAEDSPLLQQWAICVYEDWILFSSHADMLRSAIDQSRQGKDGLGGQADYEQAKQAIMQLSDKDACAWKIARNQLAYKVQYELFRQGKLQESESMLASLLAKMLDRDSELKEKIVPTIKGNNLPPYEEIAKYLRPSGFKVVTTDQGWAFGGLLIGREPAVSGKYEVGTARFGVTATESRR